MSTTGFRIPFGRSGDGERLGEGGEGPLVGSGESLAVGEGSLGEGERLSVLGTGDLLLCTLPSGVVVST